MPNDSRIIIPGRVPTAQSEDMVRYELPLGDGSEGTRYVSLGKKATLSGYFDDVFTRVLAAAGTGGATALLAHGCQVVWVFSAKAHELVLARLKGIDGRLDEMETRIEALTEENKELRDQLDAV